MIITIIMQPCKKLEFWEQVEHSVVKKYNGILVSKLNAAKKIHSIYFQTAKKYYTSNELKITLHLKKTYKRPFSLSKDFDVLTESGLGYIRVHVA